MKKRICLGLYALVLSFSVNANLEVVRTLKTPYEYDVRQDYYTSLLRKALNKGANGRKVPKLEETMFMEQGRAAYELNRGALIDIFWMGTSIDREQQLRAIKIPLERGLIGYRRFIIRADSRARFDAITNLDKLKTQVACQGVDWPDVDILRAAGLKVTATPGFEILFQQLAGKRCDYFPRGYFEVDPELKSFGQRYPQLQPHNSLILYYPYAIYFFVNHKNEALAQWIEQGLEKMIDDGELLEHMKRHPLTSHVFPLQNEFAPWNIIQISNPSLSANTDTTNSRYWFQPEDFK